MNIVESEPSRGELLVDCVPLARGESLRVTDPRSLLVYVAQGRVEIFAKGTWHLTMLEKGGWYRLGGTGVTSVDATAATVLLLMSPQAAGYARSLVTEPTQNLLADEYRAVA